MIGLSLAAGAAALAIPTGFRPLPECTPTSQTPCVIRHDWDVGELTKRLEAKDWIWWLDHDRLTVVAKKKQYPWLLLCCDVQTPLEPIPSSDLLGVTVEIPSMDKAILQIIPAPMPGQAAIIRGQNAPAELERSTPLKGKLVTRRIYSKETGGYRTLSIYTPPDISKTEKLPVLYLADDLADDFAPIAEQAILGKGARPAIIVGVSAAPVDLQCANSDCDRRSEEYLTDTITPGKKNNRAYDKHQAFFLNEVVPYIERNYPASRVRTDRCIGGTSNGASWALTMAEASPERFGCVMAFSSGSGVAQDFAYRLKSVRVSGGYGTLDLKFAKTTKSILSKARIGGANVEEYSVVAGHSMIAWEYLFASAYSKLFSARIDHRR